jgi:transposase
VRAKHHRGTTVEHYAGLDVSLESTSVCIVDGGGRIVREAKLASEPEALVSFFRMHGVPMARIGLEAGPLSQWLYAGLAAKELPAELIETRHVRAADRAPRRGCSWLGLASMLGRDGTHQLAVAGRLMMARSCQAL